MLDTTAAHVFERWRRRFEENRHRPDPDWSLGAEIPAALAASLARFQIGEGSDGDGMIRAAARSGQAGYLAAVRLFVNEEQDHSRLLGRLLAAAGRPTITAHWSDTVFRSLRWRARLRREVMVLTVAEVCALPYYQAVRDGADDPLTREVAARILADEQEHVPFHLHCLRLEFAGLPAPVRALLTAVWWALFVPSAAVVAVNHRAALRLLRMPPTRYFSEACRLFASVNRETGNRGSILPARRL
ncbi:ferritin-like domain-containing protein [Frankia sp. AgB1.9]|uniref:ferritin-like domain-containing protein n=1 Tax=unclassified Frankia TaxID=2632575 RepID=UPI001932D8CD|nr:MULTISPECIES: ferritin-like domain-containing protein [unclassified Frankia]MBL7487290.1 ferritin-like domain-containing protein [Frankia sp. AgW1.1]MBL7546297.1 ferritin-like domain-containing protein [Frankia sp. AgB1.9]MBL7618658.1 ferritin-like domain-containing protein [Frankia sp. AgB1.8]